MTPIRAFAILLLLAGTQEPVVQLVLSTKDAQVIVGVPSVSTLKIENSLGTLDMALRKFTKLKFEGETVTGTASDGTTLKGKLQAKTLKVKTLVGDLELPLASLKEADVRFGPPSSPFGARQPAELQFMIRTKDGNDLVGTTDLLKIPFESTLAKFEIDVREVSALTRTIDPQLLTLQDGSQIRGTPKLPAGIKIKSSVGEFTIKAEDISLISFRGVRPGEPADAGRTPPRGVSAPPPPAPKPPSVEPTQKRDVQAALADLRISKDGKHVYAINATDSRLCRWKLPGLEEDGAVSLPGGETALSFDPTGDWIFAAGKNSITVLAGEPLTVRKTFAVEVAVEDVHALDKDNLLTTGPQVTAIVSVSKTAVLEKFQGGASVLTPAGDRIYAGELIIQVRKVSGKFQFETAIRSFGTGHGAGGMSLSPDGRYGCTQFDGIVLRLGRCWSAARVQLAQLDRNCAPVFSKESDRLFLFTDQGFLKVHGVADWKVEATHFLGIRVVQAVLEPEGKSILVAGWPVGEIQARSHMGRQDRGRAVNLYRYQIPK